MEHLGSSFFHQQNFLRQPFKLYNIKKLPATQKKKCLEALLLTLQEDFSLTKYILRNILGRKSIQVLNFGIIE